MDFFVILSFIAMVLAPCVVALWGRARAEEDGFASLQHPPIQTAAAQDVAAEQPVSGSEPEPLRPFAALFAADGPLARRVRKVSRVITAPRPASDDIVDTAVAEKQPLQPTIAAQTSQPLEPAALSLEELLREAMESAHIARAASLRADAAASGAAARMAAFRAENAAEQARLAHNHAGAAEQAAQFAQAAYESARTQAERAAEELADKPEDTTHPEEIRQSIRLVSDRRAA